jgi:hypothetical protein
MKLKDYLNSIQFKIMFMIIDMWWIKFLAKNGEYEFSFEHYQTLRTLDEVFNLW